MVASLLLTGFVLTSLLPQQQKQISFQEFKNTLLEPGLVDHIEVANKSVAKVYVRSSPRTKDETSEDSVKGPDDSSSGGVSSKYKYYFNIGSVDFFEEKLEEAQEALGVDRHDFVPVIYVAQVNWFGELMKYAPTILLLGVLWFMGQKMPGIGGPGGSGGKGIFNIGKAQITKLDKNAKNKVFFKDVAGCDEAARNYGICALPQEP
ncbi:hypothetical protein ACLB2K_065392 [Fragaria x ananassa]